MNYVAVGISRKIEESFEKRGMGFFAKKEGLYCFTKIHFDFLGETRWDKMCWKVESLGFMLIVNTWRNARNRSPNI
jgi:hypothetical protein